MSIQNFIQAEDKVGFEEALGKGKVTENQIAFIESDDLIWARGKYYGAIPDNEDLTKNKSGELQFSDRLYSPENFSGKGYKILRKNMVAGKNVLTQEMITDPNTIYEIRYDYDLEGAEITIPEGCTLKFEGGSFSNGALNGEGVYLSNTKFNNIRLKTIILNNTTTDCELKNIESFITALNSDNVSEINLFGKTITDFSDISHKINKSRKIIIKNGTFNLTGNNRISFTSMDSEIIFDNIKVVSNENCSFIMEMDTVRNKYIFNNCIFEGIDLTDKLSFYIWGLFKSLILYNCKFYNARLWSSTHSNNDVGFLPSNLLIIENCYFEYSGTKDQGNADCINFGVVENIFIKNNTFVNIKYTCIDAYCSSKLVITGNKFLGCSNCIELKSVYRNSDNWKEGKGTGEYERCTGVIISNNYFEDNEVSVNMNAFDETTDDGTYIKDKIPSKEKLSILISNNIFNIFTTTSTEKEYYGILGMGFKQITISNNIVYTINPKFCFYRDTSAYKNMNLFNNNIIISSNNIKYDVALGVYNFVIYLFTPSTIKIINNLIDLDKNSNKASGIALSANLYNIDCEIINTSTILNLLEKENNSTINITIKDTDDLEIYPRCTKSIIKLYNCNNVILNKADKNLSYIGAYNSNGYFVTPLKDTDKCLCDSNSYFRTSNYDYRDTYNIKLKKQFNTLDELLQLELPVIDNYVYIKDNKEYKFNLNGNKSAWIDSNGNPIDALKQGTTEQRPTGVKAGFYYFDTDINKPIWKKEDTGTAWVDSTGIEV